MQIFEIFWLVIVLVGIPTLLRKWIEDHKVITCCIVYDIRAVFWPVNVASTPAMQAHVKTAVLLEAFLWIVDVPEFREAITTTKLLLTKFFEFSMLQIFFIERVQLFFAKNMFQHISARIKVKFLISLVNLWKLMLNL